ncbi:MAG TPA: 4Fe-4S ferredoxin [Sporomusaceae bacterium]|jgi:ferredoxin like protein|nr:4Fe-4S ferredoxin [Sporomusaceae bacterium]
MNTLYTKINSLHFEPDDSWQHVIIGDQNICKDCQSKACLTICPTEVFLWNHADNTPIGVLYKQCIECGACRLVCPFKNIEFCYPKGGYGVMYTEEHPIS